MKLNPPANDNYAAVVVQIKTLTPLEGCDNVVGTPLFGMQAIVGKNTQVGDIGLFFPAETQLSEQYAHHNNLFRHGNLNADEGAKGYLEDNRRVKAMKFRGHRSDALFMPLASLAFTAAQLEELKLGDTFDELNGIPVCNKYVVSTHRQGAPREEKNKGKQFKRVEAKFLPENYDTDNFFRNVDKLNPDRDVVVTQKLHGTSIRIGNTVVRRKLSLRERIAQRLGVNVKTHEYDYVFGSRRVIKDVNNPYQNHFYSTDIWTEFGKTLEGVLPDGYILYGELLGWVAPGQPIQKHYTYCVPDGTQELYVYRVATVNEQGVICDLAWDQLREFCRDRGLKYVPELWRGKLRDLEVEQFLDRRYADTGFTQAVQLEPQFDLPDEGVCVRIEGVAPYILKAKSPVFLQHESKMLDEEAVDVEAEGSLNEGGTDANN